MRSSIEANRPRWSAPAAARGFFEIWFLTIFDPASRRAWWLRYTLFAGRDGARRGMVWAAAFDAHSGESVSGKRIVPIERCAVAGFDAGGVQIDDCVLGQGFCRGRQRTREGRELRWDLRFMPAADEAERGPVWLARLPAPTQVRHANCEVGFEGWVSLDGERTPLRDARGQQKHLWGTRRVERLYWLYCPQFDSAPDAAFEALSVWPQVSGPKLAPVWLHADAQHYRGWGLPGLLRNRVEMIAPGALRATATTARWRVTAQADCDPRSLVGYVYRDPAGGDVHVAQSDVARCRLQLATRTSPGGGWRVMRELHTGLAAVEFHDRQALPGVDYLPWDRSCD